MMIGCLSPSEWLTGSSAQPEIGCHSLVHWLAASVHWNGWLALWPSQRLAVTVLWIGWLGLRPSWKLAARSVFGCKPHYQTTALGAALAPSQVGHGDGNRLQKLERSVFKSSCSRQDFGFFMDEWRRYATSSRTQDNGLLRVQLLQCVETSLRKNCRTQLVQTVWDRYRWQT
jgi:hypothetical protein